MNILIAGYGFVGQAHQAALKDTFDVTVYDPAKRPHRLWYATGHNYLCKYSSTPKWFM